MGNRLAASCICMDTTPGVPLETGDLSPKTRNSFLIIARNFHVSLALSKCSFAPSADLAMHVPPLRSLANPPIRVCWTQRLYIRYEYTIHVVRGKTTPESFK